MPGFTPGGLRWPARFAYAATGLFSAASGITNLLYGIAKGTDLGTSLVWGAVSIAVSIVFSLSWLAFLVSVDHRRWMRAVMVLCAPAWVAAASTPAHTNPIQMSLVRMRPSPSSIVVL